MGKRSPKSCPRSLSLLNQMQMVDELLRWASAVYGKSATARMESARDIREQLESTTSPHNLDLPASAFVKLPETSSTFGGHQTACIVKVDVAPRTGRILKITYTPS